MDANRFDVLTRSLSTASSRRMALSLTLGGALGLLGLSGAGAKKKQQKGKKPKPNTYGCLNVGQSCRGRDDLCCSGICEGQQPKKGKRDKSRCVSHNAGSCTPERSLCVTGGIASVCTPGVTTAVCLTTTGNAGFCATTQGLSKEVNCQVCGSDADCADMGFPPGSACVILTGVGCTANNDCNGTNGSTGTACIPPGI